MWSQIVATSYDDSDPEASRALANRRIGKLEDRMLPAQIVEAHRFAREWKAAHPRGP